MALIETEREVLFFNLRLLTERSTGRLWTQPLPTTFQALSGRVKSNSAFVKRRGKKRTLRIRRASIGRRRIVLLLSLSDKDGSDPAFEHHGRGTLRTVGKENGEGLSLSAHLVIRPDLAFNGGCLAALERIPGLSRSAIQPLLAQELCQGSTYTRSSVEPGKRVPTFAYPELSPLLSQRLLDSLAAGHLRGLEFQRDASGPSARKQLGAKHHVPVGPLEGESVVEPVRETMTLRLQQVPENRSGWESLLKLIGLTAKSNDYTTVKITTLDPKTNSSRSIVLRTDQDPLEAALTRTTLVTVKRPLPQATDDVREDLVQQMQHQLDTIHSEVSGQ